MKEQQVCVWLVTEPGEQFNEEVPLGVWDDALEAIRFSLTIPGGRAIPVPRYNQTKPAQRASK